MVTVTVLCAGLNVEDVNAGEDILSIRPVFSGTGAQRVPVARITVMDHDGATAGVYVLKIKGSDLRLSLQTLSRRRPTYHERLRAERKARSDPITALLLGVQSDAESENGQRP